jgi:catechol 2,3-dioxygenase-like lactoylglutathione lyase family enzyme
MALERLDHYSIRTAKLDETRDFYTSVLGLSVGPRPDFPFPGVWLYQKDRAVVHVIGIDPNDTAGLLQYLGGSDAGDAIGTGSLDHVAFVATGLSDMQSRLQRDKIPHKERKVPGLGLHQVFVEDPNGVTIELNYPASEAAAA